MKSLQNACCPSSQFCHKSEAAWGSPASVTAEHSQCFSSARLSEMLSPEALKLSCSDKTAPGQKDETLTASILIHFQLLVCLQGSVSVSDPEVNISAERKRRGGKWVDSNYKTGVVNEYFMCSVCSLHKLLNQWM